MFVRGANLLKLSKSMLAHPASASFFPIQLVSNKSRALLQPIRFYGNTPPSFTRNYATQKIDSPPKTERVLYKSHFKSNFTISINSPKLVKKEKSLKKLHLFQKLQKNQRALENLFGRKNVEFATFSFQKTLKMKKNCSKSMHTAQPSITTLTSFTLISPKSRLEPPAQLAATKSYTDLTESTNLPKYFILKVMLLRYLY
jgi:hypothetical protein